MEKIIYLDYHKLKKQNKNLEDFLPVAISNNKFVKININLIRDCLVEWYKTDQELHLMRKNNENKNSIGSTF